MRASVMRVAAVAALMSAFAVVGTASASADTTSCNASGTIKLSPGLSTTAHVQNVIIKGTLTECHDEESSVTGAAFVAHFHTAEAVTCSTLTGAGVGAAAEENKVVVKWTPAGGGNSLGTISVPITEVPGAPVSGLISEGPFAEDAISGTLSQTYAGGATCGVTEGKKKAKKVNKGTVSGSISIA